MRCWSPGRLDTPPPKASTSLPLIVGGAIRFSGWRPLFSHNLAPMENVPPVPAVQTVGLTRSYGPMVALNALDLTINRGDLFGFIGSNGAGKTTTLRILATFLTPSAGQARVLGHDVVRDADAVRHIIGYMPDFFGVYKDMEVTEYLDFFGACYKIPAASGRKRSMTFLNWSVFPKRKGRLLGR